VRGLTIWRKLLGVEQVQVLDVALQEAAGQQVLVVAVRPTKGARGRCGRCLRRCPGYDQGGGIRRWRSLDCGSTMVFVQAQAPRVTCGRHGVVVVAAVPWARPGARATRAFEDQCAWLAARTATSVVAELMRTSWRHVSAIIERVVNDGFAERDVLAGLARIGIDEISHRKGHRYLTCVVDQDSGRLVWAAPGHNSDTLHQFFDQLGADRCAALTHVSADGAQWIHDTVTARAPQAVLGLDPFHVVGWATREDVDFDRWDVEDLPAGAAHFRRAGQVRSAPAAAARFVADHHIRVGDLFQGLSGVPVLSAGLALGGCAQRPGRRFAGAVGRGRLGRVLRVGPQLRFQVGDPHFQRRVLCLQLDDPGLVGFPHRIHLVLQGPDHRDQVRDSQVHARPRIPDRHPVKKGGPESGTDTLIALTVPEIRRLLIQLIWIDPLDPDATLTRSTWRRRHQQRARQCHYRTRGHHP